MNIETHDEAADSGTESLPPAEEDVIIEDDPSEQESAEEIAEGVGEVPVEEQEGDEVEAESDQQVDGEEAEEVSESEEGSSLSSLLSFAVLGLLIWKLPELLDQNDDDEISVI